MQAERRASKLDFRRVTEKLEDKAWTGAPRWWPVGRESHRGPWSKRTFRGVFTLAGPIPCALREKGRIGWPNFFFNVKHGQDWAT